MSYYFQAGISLETSYKDILNCCLVHGRKRKVRGFDTIELSPFLWTTDHPLRNVLTNPARKINCGFMTAEWLWLMAGRNDLEMISYYNSKLKNYSDDGQHLAGAYGPTLAKGLKYVYKKLKYDQGSRQAVIQLFQNNPTESKDVECTLSLQFLIDDGYLDLIVTMRSNDLWLGFPYDVYNFTMIQNYVAFKLGVQLGRYTHQAGSAHLYQEHLNMAKLACTSKTLVQEIYETQQILSDQLAAILLLEQQLRRQELVELADLANLDEPWQTMVQTLIKHQLAKHAKK